LRWRRPGRVEASNRDSNVLIERDAVIGAALDAWMHQPNWNRGATTENVTFNTVADHIDCVCQLAGNARQAAIGTEEPLYRPPEDRRATPRPLLRRIRHRAHLPR
jgi:hypothetical protein